jgi:hypothetical protein
VPPSIPDLDGYRSDAERHLADPGPAADAAHAHLFSADAVAGTEAAAAGGDRHLRALARFAAEGHLRLASAGEMADVDALLRAPLVAGAGSGAVTLREVDALLAAEPDAERRRELQGARLRAIDSHLSELLADAALRRADAAPSARVCGRDLERIEADAGRVLSGSDDIAARALDVAARGAIGPAASALDPADLPRVARAPQHEADLPTAAVASAIARTREAMGSRDAATDRSEMQGVAGALEMLRGAGAALARGGVSPRRRMEARLLADPALVHAHAALLEGLLAEPEWLRRVLGAPEPEPVATAAATMRLLAARSAAAGSASLRSEANADLMSRALCVAWPAELSLVARLGSLGPCDELRGRMLAAALRIHLRETFGERWFLETAAARLLRELWLEGGDLDPGDLARELGSAGLDPALVIAEAGERLG